MNNPPASDALAASSRGHWKLRALGWPPVAEGLEAALREVIEQTGKAEIREGWLETPNAKWRVAVCINRPDLPATNGDLFDVIFEGEPDPTEESAAANSLSPSSKEEFLHKLAHDLRTPLSALQLWIKVLTEGDDELPLSVREGLEAIRQCADEQQTLVKNLVSRPFPQ